jgi:hypothetical protein
MPTFRADRAISPFLKEPFFGHTTFNWALEGKYTCSLSYCSVGIDTFADDECVGNTSISSGYNSVDDNAFHSFQKILGFVSPNSIVRVRLHLCHMCIQHGHCCSATILVSNVPVVGTSVNMVVYLGFTILTC